MSRWIIAFAALLTVALASTGLDYITGDISHDDERFFTADVMTWGVTALIISAASAIALIGRFTKLMVGASLAAGVTYILFAINQATIIVPNRPLDDWRMGVNMAVFGGLWLTVSAYVAIQDYVRRRGDDAGGGDR